MKIGYAGVSTIEQNPDLQHDALRKVGCKKITLNMHLRYTKDEMYLLCPRQIMQLFQ